MRRLMYSMFLIIFVCISQVLGANVVTTIGNVSGSRNDKSIEVDISLSDVSDLGIVSSDILLNYDSNRLTFSTATFRGTIANHFPEPVFNNDNAGSVFFALYGSTAIAGEGIFIKLFFDVNSYAQDGVSSLTIPSITFNDGINLTTSTVSGSFTIFTVIDTSSPTAVVGLVASNISQTGWTLSWDAATDNNSVAGYYLYRNNVKVATVSGSECTIWSHTTVPGQVDGGIDNPVELGVKFRSDISGVISGIRFYKYITNTGTHTGNLWTSAGTLLASATFVDETASGWQQVLFSVPVAISSNTVYVASYHANNGHYSADLNYFMSRGVDNSPIHALASDISGGNGVYAYGSSSIFPNQTWYSANYWVDVIFCSGASVISYTATGLTAGTSYYCQVTAYDAAGNESAKQTPSFKIVTLNSGIDNTPPSVVTGLTASNITNTSFVLRWSSATDNVGVTGYYIYKDGSKVATITSGLVYNATGLKRGKTYTYKVSAYDAANNESAQSQGLVVRIGSSSGISQNLSYNQNNSLFIEVEENFGIAVDIPSNSFMEDTVMEVWKIEPIVTGANASKVAFEITNDKNYQPTKEITITVNYLDESISGLDESKLVICYYDENSRWVEVPTTAYPLENRLVGKIRHFTKFQVFQRSGKSDLSQLVVYPNPYRSSKNSGGVIFSGLTSRANIKIYAITGELIRELNDDDGDGQCVWDAKNYAGNNVASGVYIYNVVNSDNKSQKVQGKVAIIR